MFALPLALALSAQASPLSDAARDAAPTDKSRTIDVHLEVDIDAPADEVWALLGPGFADAADWVNLIDSSRAMTMDEVPAGYTVDPDAPVPGRWTPSKFGDPAEVLVDYSDEDRTLTFWAANLPGILVHSQNTQQVIATGEGTSRVSFDIHAQPKFRFMRNKVASILERGLGTVLVDLKVKAETGERRTEELARR